MRSGSIRDKFQNYTFVPEQSLKKAKFIDIVEIDSEVITPVTLSTANGAYLSGNYKMTEFNQGSGGQTENERLLSIYTNKDPKELIS